MKKFDRVRDLFVANQNLPRKEMVALIVKKIGGSESSASTYISYVRKELGMAPLKRGRPSTKTVTPQAEVAPKKRGRPRKIVSETHSEPRVINHTSEVKPRAQASSERRQEAIASRPFKAEAKKFLKWRDRQPSLEDVIYEEMGFSYDDKMEAREMLSVEMGRTLY